MSRTHGVYRIGQYSPSDYDFSKGVFCAVPGARKTPPLNSQAPQRGTGAQGVKSAPPPIKRGYQVLIVCFCTLSNAEDKKTPRVVFRNHPRVVAKGPA
jgi:hypothetical protein